MKSTSLAFAAATTLLAHITYAQPRFVTLAIGTNNPTDQVTIGTNEVADIRSTGPQPIPGTYLLVAKDSRIFTLSGDRFFPTYAAYQPKTMIAGPATVTLRSDAQPASIAPAFATIEIIPECFPPDKTIVVPAGTEGANILMEASPDLIHWTNAPPGPYTNLTSHLFFRLRVERIP